MLSIGFRQRWGAGIQADLKTIGALGCYGMTAITALTVKRMGGTEYSRRSATRPSEAD
jgi:hydroxymethylpyrimidine/phosphomethylpyrimidine kinase